MSAKRLAALSLFLQKLPERRASSIATTNGMSPTSLAFRAQDVLTPLCPRKLVVHLSYNIAKIEHVRDSRVLDVRELEACLLLPGKTPEPPRIELGKKEALLVLPAPDSTKQAKT